MSEFPLYHTVEYDPFIKSQLASRNQLSDLMWCKFGHVPPDVWGDQTCGIDCAGLQDRSSILVPRERVRAVLGQIVSWFRV